MFVRYFSHLRVITSRTLLFERNLIHVQLRCCSSDTDPTTSTPNDSEKAFTLSSDFALSNEWKNRVQELSVAELGGEDFEWISALQKKYSAGGIASAIDLDLACLVSDQFSQVSDLVTLCYKFRHTENAADLFPSTELLLEFNDVDTFMKVFNDPFNYGLFMNEHICCLFLDQFLSSGNFQVAAKVATYVMQQELFSWPLLNFLAISALLHWTELDPSSRNFSEQIHTRRSAMLEDETSFNEENVRLFRYPYLKNPYWDGHFDLFEPDQLVGKSLEWLSWHLKLAKGDEQQNKRNLALTEAINLLGLLLQQKWASANGRLNALLRNVGEASESDILRAFLQTALPIIESNKEIKVEENKEENQQKVESEFKNEEERDKLMNLIKQKYSEFDDIGNKQLKLSEILSKAFQPIFKEEEQRLKEQQQKEFAAWNEHRKKFIHSQAERAELIARLDEIQKRRKELTEERNLLYFFENRVRIEDEARYRDMLIQEMGLMKKRGDLTEEEYAKGMFHLARQLKEGKTAKQALEEIAESELFTRIQRKKPISPT